MAYERDDWSCLSDTPLPREWFSVTERYTYFNHAAVGVLPLPSREALKHFIDAHAEGGVMGVFGTELRMPDIRSKIGSFVGAAGEDIAILRNTGDGANAIAGGFPFRGGDEVLLPGNEFPANALPWLALRERGVNVRLLDARERLTPERLRSEISARTRIVAVSWVSFLDGYRHDLAGLSDVAHACGASFVVDAAQGLGAFPLDVRALAIDAVYCCGAKWMLALQGVSFLYVSSALRDHLKLAAPGWRSAEDMWDFLNYDQPSAKEAAKYEGGTPNFIGALSLEKAIDAFESAGRKEIATHVLALTDRLSEGLASCGARILSARSDGTSSGIVTFAKPGTDSVALGKALQREGFITTYRSSGIRVSPHGYNTLEEIDRFTETLRGIKVEPSFRPA